MLIPCPVCNEPLDAWLEPDPEGRWAKSGLRVRLEVRPNCTCDLSVFHHGRLLDRLDLNYEDPAIVAHFAAKREQERLNWEAQRARERQIEQEHRDREVQRRAQRDMDLQARPTEPRGQVVGRLERFQDVAATIEDGLAGKPFSWRGVDRQHYEPVARAMGITLITKSRAEKAGFVLKRGQQPVGSVYFNAPISRSAPVYVLECQFNRVGQGEDAQATLDLAEAAG